MTVPTPRRRLTRLEEDWYFAKIRKTRDPRHLKAFLQYKSLTDLVFLGRVLLGYDKLGDAWHYWMADWVERPTNSLKALLGPRKTYKSVLLNTTRGIQRILRDPNIEVLLVSQNVDNVRDRLVEIEKHFEENQRFRAVWGDWVKQDEWSLERFTVNRRTEIRNDPTMGIASPEKDKTSKHPSYIVVDDLEAKGNVRFPLSRRKICEFFESLFGLLKPVGEMLVCNAPQHFEAITFGMLLNRKMEYHKFFDKAVVPICVPDAGGGVYYIMPSVYDEAGCRRERALVGERNWACEYALWPMGEGLDRFDRAKLPGALIAKEPPGLVKVCIFDPSGGATGKSDYAGIVVVGVDDKGRKYIVDARQRRAKAIAICREGIEVARAHGCKVIAPEVSGPGIGYVGLLEDVLPDMPGAPLKIRKVTTDNRAKGGRIAQGLIAPYEKGELFIMAHLRDFIHELENYAGDSEGNTAGQDNMLDAASYADEVPGFRPPKVMREETADEKVRREMSEQQQEFAKHLVGDKGKMRQVEWAGGLPGFM